MPARATATNPIDVAGAADEDPLSFAWLAEVCLKDPEIDGVIITGLFGGYRWLLSTDFGPREEAAAHELGELARQYRKPVLMQSIYARYDIPALHILRDEGVPYYESIEITCRAMATASRGEVTSAPAGYATSGSPTSWKLYRRVLTRMLVTAGSPLG